MNQPVTWGPPHAERADAARNRRLLLATAREMVAAQGADKLTMDGLAERAGLGKGTVFRRFGTRAGIFQALLDDDEREFQEQVLSGPPPLGPGRPAAGPADRLRPRQDRLPDRAPRDRAGRAGRPGAGAGRIGDAHVAGTHPVSARGDPPRRRRPGRAGHPAHRGPGRPAAALPVVRRPDRGGGRRCPNASAGAGRTWSSASAAHDETAVSTPGRRGLHPGSGRVWCLRVRGPGDEPSAAAGTRPSTAVKAIVCVHHAGSAH